MFDVAFCHFVFRSGLCHLFVHEDVFRATGRLSSCSFEGRFAPRSTDSRTNVENTGPDNNESEEYEGRSNAESTNLQNYGEEGRLCRPWSPATPRGDVPPEQPNWSLSRPQLSFNVVTLGRTVGLQGPYAPQGSTSLLPKLSVTSKVSARTSYPWVGSQVHFRSSEDVTLLEFTSPVDREYKRRRRKFHWI